MNTFNYFGYASNLKQSLLEERIDGHHPQNVFTGKLNNYQFCFNHRESNGEIKANIIPKKEINVLGIVYIIDEKYFDILFKSAPQYRIIKVDIQLDSDNSIIKSKTFITDNITSEYSIPSNEYLQTILTGASQHNLPEEYMNYIVSITNIKQK
jgi:hypothetical protein